ncbi:hypothetical protein B0A55_02029 [Friedmanniomyces simplex]|uniref:Uncharacterized protein n=1 Tax=Friedmanniomyces simplex TaxID=329884 RepID=A0A4U0Y3P4_9PEZI|nr:hypothetical protein B0A55_02029 [Friedmanniomyces simplex]
MNWPGKASYEMRSKVDTAISYAAGTRHVRNWGFECDEGDDSTEVEKLFKLFLDPSLVDVSEYAPAHHEAQQWYRDYLAEPYQCIMQFLRDRVARFETKRIKFVFAVPTTWKDPATIADIERSIRAAGCGKQTRQRVAITLTEAGAAAVYAAEQQKQRGDVFLVCDAGGGTTDLNVLKVSSASRGRTELEPLHCNEGEAIGSTLIDHKAEKLVLDRLQRVEAELHGADLESLARRTIKDRFMSYKCSFGSGVMNMPKLPLPIPDIAPGQDFPIAGIENSNLVLTREDLQALFDEQIQRICDLLDEQLRVVQYSHPDESVSYLVLSGGLCSSPYVQKRIRDRYERGAGPGCANAQKMTILLATDPQLAVVHELLLARRQALRGGPEMLSTRRCPVSYGVLCREPYDATKHQGEDVVQDPFTKKRFAEKQVSWFIKQGDKIDVKQGINQRFPFKIPLGCERDPWRTKIVMSSMPANQLPRSLRHEGVKQVCTVETVLDTVDMKRKNNKWYHLKTEYNEAEFDVKLLIGTGLHFEIWGQEGKNSKSHEEIEVEWEVPHDMDVKTSGAHDGRGMYRVA